MFRAGRRIQTKALLSGAWFPLGWRFVHLDWRTSSEGAQYLLILGSEESEGLWLTDQIT
jgi:hypothetical protein